MKPVKILGIGATLTCGEGLKTLRQALETGRGRLDSNVSVAGLDAFIPPGRTRRLDLLSRMALLTACLALGDAKVSLEDVRGPETGIVLGTALGPQQSTFAFLDGIIDSGDSGASSFAFTNSVHSIPASQVSLALGICGPVRTVTNFESTAGAALGAAMHWIEQDMVKRVVLILGEESSPVEDYVVKQLGGGAAEVRPLAEGCSYANRGGCVALVLGSEGDGYGRIVSVGQSLTGREAAERIADKDMLFSAAAGKADEFSLYRELAGHAVRVAAHSPLYGSFMTGLGVELAVAAMALRGKTLWPQPGGQMSGSAQSSVTPAAIRSAAVAGVSGPGRLTVVELGP